jgi:hypothetical protein
MYLIGLLHIQSPELIGFTGGSQDRAARLYGRQPQPEPSGPRAGGSLEGGPDSSRSSYRHSPRPPIHMRNARCRADNLSLVYAF